MNRKTFAILILFLAIPLSQKAMAQLPPDGPGCPGQYLFNDGTYWAYEKVQCGLRDVNPPNDCNYSTSNPTQILIFDRVLGSTNPPCVPNGMTDCKCADMTVPVGSGGAGPLRYKPNGKQPAKFNGAGDTGGNVINTKEFVGKFSKDLNGDGSIGPGETYWYKFIQGDVEKGTGTPITFYYCYKINPGDSPVKKADAGGGDFTPDEWFIKNMDGTDIKVDEIVGPTKQVTATVDDKPTTYTVLYAPPAKVKKKAGTTGTPGSTGTTPTPMPDTNKKSTPTPMPDSDKQ